MNNIIEIYTDGSAIGNGTEKSKCGWACELIWNDYTMVKSGHALGLTNNQAEMTAVLMALRSVNRKEHPTYVYSDSLYVVKTLNGEYQIGANEDLWEQLFDEKQKFKDIHFVWIKGHSGNPHNEKVDALAFKEAQNADTVPE